MADAPLLATALNPTLGYDRVAAITRRAVSEGLTLRAAIALSLTMADACDRLVDLVAMTSAGAGRRRDPDYWRGTLPDGTSLAHCDA